MERPIIKRMTLQRSQVEAFIEILNMHKTDDDKEESEPLNQDDIELAINQFEHLARMQKENAKFVKRQLTKMLDRAVKTEESVSNMYI